MTLPAGAKSRLRNHRNDPEGTPHLMDFSHLEGALAAPGDSIKKPKRWGRAENAG